GVGLLPARFIARKEFIGTVKVLRPPSFELHLSVAIVRVGQLGALERAVELLEHGIRHLFEAANTTKPGNEEPKGCARESAEVAIAQVVAAHIRNLKCVLQTENPFPGFRKCQMSQCRS